MGAWARCADLGSDQVYGQWMISAAGDGIGVCPDCGRQSFHRHGWHERRLQDLPAQGAPVAVKLRIQRWQCRNKTCKRQTFAGQLPDKRPLWARHCSGS